MFNYNSLLRLNSENIFILQLNFWVNQHNFVTIGM